MHHESILAHLAPLLTNQIENVATDALAHLLLQYHFLADAFREYISSMMVDLAGNLSFTTQARWQDNAIPDLVGQDEQGRYLLIIESKFWARLTSNQPATYIDRLPPDKPALLLFIAPASRIPTLWKELMSRCTAILPREELKGEIKGEIRNLLLNNKHTLSLISWENLFGVLARKAKAVNDQYAISDIWQLQSLCARIDEEAFKPISEEELTSPTKIRIAQYRELIDELIVRLVDSNIVSIKGYQATPGPDYYKRYMTINGFHNWCIEYNERYRRQHPETSLWLTTTITPQVAAMLSKLSLVGHKQGKQLLVPMEIPIGVERESVMISLMEQVKKVYKLLIS
jgi:hypothetical protein